MSLKRGRRIGASLPENIERMFPCYLKYYFSIKINIDFGIKLNKLISSKEY